MKKIFFIIALLFLPFNLFAQEENASVQQNNQYFNLKLTQVSQSVFDKSIKYSLEVTPLKDSAKTQILWEAPLSFTVTPKHKDFVSMAVGQTYIYEAIVHPTRGGVYEITASVTAWEYDTNYTNTVSQTLTLNDSLVSQPVSSDYQVGVILFTVLILLVSGLAIWGAVKLTKIIMVRTKNGLLHPLNLLENSKYLFLVLRIF